MLNSLVFCHVSETPQNAAAFVGRRVSFKCKAANGSIVREWFFHRFPSDKAQKKIIFVNWNVKNPLHQDLRYGLNVDENGSGELYLNETKIEDAGTYTCTIADEEQRSTHYRAELIVLGENMFNESDYKMLQMTTIAYFFRK